MITLLMGSTGKTRTWTPTQIKDLNDEGINLRDFAFKEVKSLVLARYGFLQDDCGQEVDWAFLQLREADTVISAVRRLANEYEVPAYPVHDSIIVKMSDRLISEQVLRDSFESYFGYRPILSVNF